MPQLRDLAAELVGEIPGLPHLYARKYINKAMDEIRRDYLWSWNIGEGMLITPQIVNTGLVSVTQYSITVAFDATAQAVLNNLVLLQVNPLTERQFRISGGPIYNILGYEPTTGVATLDRIYLEATSSNSQFSIYRCYYNPPSTDGVTPNFDFLRYLSILNPINGYTISGKRLYETRENLNRRDPLRGALGQPYYAVAYKPSPNGLLNGQVPTGPTAGLMQYELWPHPTNEQQYLAQYERLHVDLQPRDYLPNQCPPNLVMYRAKEFAYRWALQNMGRIPELKGVDWRFALVEVQKKYAIELVGAKRNDKEIMLTIIRPGSNGIYDTQGPIDSNYAQSHGVLGYN